MARDIGIENHRAWIGYLQPVGLVVSPHALVQCQAYVDLNVFEEQIILRGMMCKHSNKEDDSFYLSPDRFIDLFVKVLGWRESDLKSASENTELSSLFLPEYQEAISATHFVFEKKGDAAPIALGFFLDRDEDLDAQSQTSTWKASHQVKFERLLREKNIAIGFIVSPSKVRLIFAPKGESSGYITFPFHLMLEVQGRVVLAAFKMLMGESRWFSLATNSRLPALLFESRKYQNVVSTQLSEQVLAALYELLRGLQNADNHRSGELLKGVLEESRNDVYHGCLTVLLRTVFLLYAEDRDLIPAHPIYAENYSIKGLFERLRSDESRYADTMDLRYGAWAQLITLFRIVYEGIDFPGFTLPARHGHLFNPDRFLFLEGRTSLKEVIEPPLISDGVLFRVLNNLMMLDGERISYRTLDVEQIGSVYETVMGFQLEISTGPSIAISSKKAHGAPVVINLQDILDLEPKDRAEKLNEWTDQDIKKDALIKVKTLAELESALEKKIARQATPSIIPKGSMILQPSEERMRSGSHYTPRALTEPLVRSTLEPIFSRLGANVSAQEILNLKICDPAMGSGAFLVESIRQLSEALVKAWRIHGENPNIPSDEDELLFARRMIAQRCIYGVDKNLMAVDLAKLSLWLITFAKNHAFTFLDHSLKCGDSLIGLNLDQISKGTWSPTDQESFFTQNVNTAVGEYIELRNEISFADEAKDYEALVLLNEEAQQRVERLRAAGDLILSAFFSGKTARDRSAALVQIQPILLKLFQSDSFFSYKSVLPEEFSSFHWELEFPEVFIVHKGFDVVIGNPPFLGGRKIRAKLGEGYLHYLTEVLKSGSSANADLCAFFLIRANDILKPNGMMGLIVSSSIAEGDTRVVGLQNILQSGSKIVRGYTRFPWPGIASVTISIVQIIKGQWSGKVYINDEPVVEVSSYLTSGKVTDLSPKPIRANKSLTLQGSIPYGMGFVIEEEEALRILKSDKKYQNVIYRYLVGQELNVDPMHTPSKWIINFHDWPLKDGVNVTNNQFAEYYPECLSIVQKYVYPERMAKGGDVAEYPWWHYWRPRLELYQKLEGLSFALAIATMANKYIAFGKVHGRTVYSNSISVLVSDDYGIAGLLSSNIHEVWARRYGGYNLQLIRYATTDLLETFPFPDISKELQIMGQKYFDFRERIMVDQGKGLTETYNLVHDENVQNSGIEEFRKLIIQLDNVVLKDYGWLNIDLEHGFHPTGQGTRFTISQKARDHILEKLLQLNLEVVEKETLTATVKKQPPINSKANLKKKRKTK